MNALIIFYSFIDRMLAKVGLENFHMINYTVSGKITLLGTEITSEMAVTSLLVGFAFVAAAVCLGSFVFKKRDILHVCYSWDFGRSYYYIDLYIG